MRRYLVFTLAFLVMPICGLAQTGLPPFGSIDRVDLEFRNNQNLNVVLAMPIMSSPGRGMNLDFSIVYNSLNWVPGAGTWYPAYPSNPSAQWGWLTNFDPGQTTFTQVDTQGRCGTGNNENDTYTTTYNYYKYIDPYGTSHSFPVLWRDTYSFCTQTDTITGSFAGYARDGSGYYMTISNADGSITSVLSRGGVDVTNPGVMVDPNGNYISASTPQSGETDWTDTAGRVALKVITGTSSIQYKVLDPTGAYQTTTLNLQNLSVKTNFACPNVVEYTGTASVPQSLVLPNNQQYSFTYESYVQNSTTYYTGRLQRVTLPTGGYYEYDYTGANSGINCADGTTLSMNRVVSDGTNTATWNYVRNTTNLTATITTPQLGDTPNANDMVVTFNSSGQEMSRQIFASSPGSGTPLRTINTTWATNGTPASKVTILEDGTTQSEIDTTYDSNGLLDSLSEYDWGSGAHGSLLRTTTYTYQTSTNYTSLNIIGLIISRQIKDVNGTVQYRQDITYDATSGDNQFCPTGVAQHNDSAYGCTFYYRGNPTSITTYLTPGTPANGITKNFTYDFFGNLLTAQLNCCQNKTWGYSSASTTQNYSLPDSVTSGSSPSLKTTYAYYLPTGQVNTATDQNGLVTTVSYDYLRRPTQVSQTNGANAAMSYDDTNFLTTTTTSIDASKSVKQITSLDKLGRPYLATTEDASNNVYSNVTAKYDLAGRAYQTSNPYTGSPSYWTTTAFDVLGRPTTVTLQDASVTTITYATNTTTTKDPAGNQRESVADGVGRLSSIYEPNPPTNNNPSLQTSYTYNLLDELTQIAQGSQTRTYVYDALGRLFTATTPEAGTVCFGTVSAGSCQQNTGYDTYDNLQYRTDARGVVTSYGYDGLNRLATVTYNVSGATGVPATPSLGFTYGLNSSCNSAHGAGCIGQLITMTDGAGSENYTYNSLEQLTQLQKVINGSTYTASYAYNLTSELTQIIYPSGRNVQQSVDPIGRLCEVAPTTSGCGTATAPYVTGLGYGTASQLTGFKYGNGLNASFGFSADRLQLNCLDYSTTNRTSCTHDSTTKFGLSYSYPSTPGNNGLFSGITDSVDPGRSAMYTYDSLYRLVTAATAGSANYPAWGLQEGYDRYGNRNSQSVISGCTGITCPQFSSTASTSTNRLPSPYTYDSSGNMTYDGFNTLVYDAENRVLSATNSTSSGAYVYDGNGLRVLKCVPNCTSPTTTVVFVYSGSLEIAEYDNGVAPANPTNEYIYAGGQKVALINAGITVYFHNDHLSPRMRTDSSGNTVDQRGTFPFGEAWYLPPAGAAWVFTSYYRDSESGNDYAQARYDVSRLGRFSSPDPIAGNTSNPQSWNRYTYVMNNPLGYTDPTGLLCVDGNGNGMTDENGNAIDEGGCGGAGGSWIPPAPPVTVQVNASGDSGPVTVVWNLGGPSLGSDNSSWAWTFTKNFVSNFFSASFYKQELAHGGCLAVFQEAAGEPMQEIYHGAEVAGEVGAGLIGGAQAAGSLANELYPMSLSQGTGPKLDPFVGPLVISGARSIASAAGRWGFAAEHVATKALPGAALAAIDTSLAYGLYREAQAAATGACH